MMELQPIKFVAAKLWHRRWYLLLLWIVMSVLWFAVALLIGPVNLEILKFLWQSGVLMVLQPALPHVAIVAVAFSFFWFRVSLLEPPGRPWSWIAMRHLLGHPSNCIRFAGLAAVALAATIVGYGLSWVALYWLLRVGAIWPPSYFRGLLGQTGTVMLFGVLACLPLVLAVPLLIRGAIVLAAAAIGESLTFAEASEIASAAQIGQARWILLVLALLLSIPIDPVILLLPMPDESVMSQARFLAISAIRAAPTLVASAILIELVCGLYRTARPQGNQSCPSRS